MGLSLFVSFHLEYFMNRKKKEKIQALFSVPHVEQAEARGSEALWAASERAAPRSLKEAAGLHCHPPRTAGSVAWSLPTVKKEGSAAAFDRGPDRPVASTRA